MIEAARRAESRTIEPRPGAWADALRRRDQSDRAGRFREQLGLPTDRPIVMTGHQAEFWHPGILAKYLAAHAAAARFGAQAAWVVVDQDANDLSRVRYPVRLRQRADDGADRFAARAWILCDRGLTGAGGEALPTSRIRAFEPAAIPVPGSGESFAAACVGDGLARIRDSMFRHAGAPNAAAQVSAALGDLLEPLVGAAPTVMATRMAGTDLFSWVVARMTDDPRACAAAYNRAVDAFPHARMTRLAVNDVQYLYELPLWRFDDAGGGERRRAFAHDLEEVDIAHLAPRAALMTGLLRLAACELFIAGTGGGGPGGYERVAERWLGEWLGERLKPEAVVSATVHLPMGAEPIEQDEAARAIWAAHHAQHNPDMLGDEPAERRKRAMVERIESIRAAGDDPSAEFFAMHEMLAQVRRSHADRMASFERRAAEARARLEDAKVLNDRTWPFAVYPPDQIRALAERIDAAFGA